MNKKCSFIIFIAVFFLVSGGLFAQNTQELRVGSRVSATMRNGGDQWYSVRPSSNGILTVQTFGDLDTYIEVYDSSNNLIYDNDDWEDDSYNARVIIFVVSGSTYRFLVRGYDSSENGPYQIMATLERPTELRVGSQVRGNIREGGENWYIITATATGIMIVETTGSTDTILTVMDVANNYIAQDDDGGSEVNARVEFFVESGSTYVIVLEGYDSGAYQIQASFETIPADTERNTERSSASVLKPGEAAAAVFRTRNESRWYSLEISRANTNVVIQTRGSMDTVMNLYDAGGRLVSDDDDSGEDYNASISTRLNAGTYYIEIKGYDGLMGRCTVHAETR
jgi:hypothetical protein